MAYSGRYQVKNPKKYLGDPTQVVYRSLWERGSTILLRNRQEVSQVLC